MGLLCILPYIYDTSSKMLMASGSKAGNVRVAGIPTSKLNLLYQLTARLLTCIGVNVPAVPNNRQLVANLVFQSHQTTSPSVWMSTVVA